MTLATLRADPVNACMADVYLTKPVSGSFTGAGNLVQGGRCTIEERALERGFVELSARADANGADYFYPWLQRGVGTVRVPGQVADGTIVMTGGVNGCSIVVTQDGTDFIFYHNGDNRHLTPEMMTGTQVARATSKDYDPLGWGEKAFNDGMAEMRRKNVSPKGEVNYAHYVIAVKVAGRFGLYSTGAMSLNGLKRLPLGLSTCLVKFG